MIKEKIVVLGSGESGIGTSLLAVKKGYNVYVSDSGIIKNEVKMIFEKYNIDWEENYHNKEKILEADIVMKSPGIAEDEEIVQIVRKKNIPIVSEIEFASRNTSAKLIGVTGSNGKTTTTLMIYEILKNFGYNVGLAGNIGKSFAKQVAERDYDYYVLEISSFQLDNINSFCPEISVITNVSIDHLDRYNYSFKTYLESKLKIALNQSKKHFLVFNSDDNELKKAIKKTNIKSELIEFGFKPKKKGTFFKDKNIITKDKNSTMMVNLNEFQLKGRHNLLNAMAAVSVGKLLSINNLAIRDSLLNFKGIEHRLEHVLKIQNITYINDSKATNINATYFALDSMSSQIVWIVGGIDKGNDYTELLPLVREKVKAIICLGLNNEKIKNIFSPIIETIIETKSMQKAVYLAQKIAKKKEFVLLSPACASFDLFKDYKDRGNQFKSAVRNL
ncbi:MAG: UDP-N-acetylmuramoyl-L-alanine--D-glutamate ligase [Flavobacteriaceae bacterium]|nr:UDP-N-acetylmuramoyl-L-alanine--D-glutamate ligase [Flavobacteriaceae bacterium]